MNLLFGLKSSRILESKGPGVSHPYSQPVAELRRTQINVHGQVEPGILKAAQAAAIRPMSHHGSHLRSI